MLVKIYPENPNKREIEKVVSILNDGGVIIYPTDTVYSLACSLNSKKGFERILQIKGVKEKDANFSIICNDLSNLSTYARVDNQQFKLLKKNLPGPFTFILEASGKVPDKYLGRKKTIGLRIPNNPIALAIVEELGYPLLTASIKNSDEVLEYITDPELIHDTYKNLVDVVIDGGFSGNEASTVVDCTIDDEPVIVREGKGELIY